MSGQQGEIGCCSDAGKKVGNLLSCADSKYIIPVGFNFFFFHDQKKKSLLWSSGWSVHHMMSNLTFLSNSNRNI